MIYQLAELFAAFIESLLLLTATTDMAEKKYAGGKHFGLLILFAGLYTAASALLRGSAIAVLAPVFCICYVIAVTKITANGKLLQRSTACMLSYFLLCFTESYTLGCGAIMIVGGAVELSGGMRLLTRPGVIRLVFLLINKILQAAIFFAGLPLYPRLRTLSRRYQAILLSAATAACAVLQVISAMIMTDSTAMMQLTVLIAVFFVALTLIATILAIAVTARYQKKKQDSEIMQRINSMMEKNFREIQSNQQRMRRQMHDFKNHLRAIDGMLAEGAPAKTYIGDLLATAYAGAKLCRSGNDVIDAIVNCKADEARNSGIALDYIISLPEELHIAATDLCAVLANQLDNAIEACARVAEDKRRIIVDIRTRQAFLFFKVVNAAEKDPFNEKHELISTKTDKSMHGLGIKNIQDAVSRYDGKLEHFYKDGVFTSIAMFQNR